MQFSTTKNDLIQAVSTVQKAVSTKSTLPILEGILFEASNEAITLLGTDMELGIKTRLEGTVKEEGSIVLSAKLISEIARKLPDGNVYFEKNNKNAVKITCNQSKFNVQGEAGEDFPKMPEVRGSEAIQIPRELFRSLIKETIFCVAKSENIPVLTGELLELENGEMKLVALDGYRLALRKGKINQGLSIKEIIPERTMMELYRLLSMKEEDLFVSTTKNQALFTIGETSMVSNLLQGEYINYKQIIPENATTKVKANTLELLASCERASLMARDGKNNLIKMHFNQGGLDIQSNSDMGDLNENLPVEMNGEPLKIAFNCNYFIDALKAISEEEVMLEFTTAVSPCVIRPVDGDYFIYLILPVRYIEHE
ncbi:DNA polymerase III subunit beta [Alkalibacter rhizosphaerae]|uniref:Beta sliding clamp n=1 Tax=Alkalibacter rhizosphaerae TaxID=2815577 RepID=A0A975AGP0_9FIRM|nr:DNA polymerase III subunit beta [Alkalibacter rhizosphaerae]QSX07582.1 DNA polymerase III subunit beta [Alkalibacter rhizosphaerae]